MRALVLSFLVLSLSASAQQAEIDRLEARLKGELATKGTKADTLRVEALTRLAELYIKVKPDRSLDLSKEALGLSIRNGNNRFLSKIYNNTGSVNRIKGEYEKAIQFHQRALDQDRKMNNKAGEALSLNNLGNVYQAQGRSAEAQKNYEQALRIRQDLGDQKGIAGTLNNLGLLHRAQGDLDKALMYFENAQRIFEQMADRIGLANTLNNIGMIHRGRGNADKALENFLAALEVFEKEGYKVGTAFTLNNIGNIYQQQGKLDEALKFYQQSLKTSEQLGDRASAAGKHSNMGGVYQAKGDLSMALKHLETALSLQHEVGDQAGEVSTLNNLGAFHREQNNTTKALEYFLEAERIQRRIGDNSYTVETLTSIGELYVKQKEGAKGLRYLERAMREAKDKRSSDELQRAYTALADAYAQSGDFERSYRFQKLNTDLQDSLERTVNVKALAEMQAKFDSERKQREIDQLNRDREVQEMLLTRQRTVRNLILVLAALIIVMAGLIYNRYRAKKKANDELDRKNREIEEQRARLAEKNVEITDSIEYAKRIQEAILPSLNEVKRLLPDSFIYFRPKAIVSGDFYWFTEKDGVAYIAAVDCTGHGVPGAFMSMIGNDHLNQVVTVEGFRRPDQILNRLHAEVQNTLKQRQGGTDTHVGMDIALCAIDLKNNHLQFASANRYLLLFKGDELLEVKGDHLNVGGIMHEDVRDYTLHHIDLNKGDTLYIFSDGLVDQFGGPDDRKFGYKRLKELLTEIKAKPMDQQQAAVESAILSWMGPSDQIDDFLLIGVKA